MALWPYFDFFSIYWKFVQQVTQQKRSAETSTSTWPTASSEENDETMTKHDGGETKLADVCAIRGNKRRHRPESVASVTKLRSDTRSMTPEKKEKKNAAVQTRPAFMPPRSPSAVAPGLSRSFLLAEPPLAITVVVYLPPPFLPGPRRCCVHWPARTDGRGAKKVWGATSSPA